MRYVLYMLCRAKGFISGLVIKSSKSKGVGGRVW